jgi:hypothetical protein
LVGECDFILSAAPPVPALRAPLVTIVEAKRNEVESGVWQCIAQMVGAREFNQQSGGGPEAIYDCVTNAETWRRCGGERATRWTLANLRGRSGANLVGRA